MTCAFLFPGQGSQYVGMTKKVERVYPLAREIFERADEVLGFPLYALTGEGKEEELTSTENAQPAILMVSVAWARFLLQEGVQPDFLSGHSLGEFSALVLSGALDLEEGLWLVHRRGLLMKEAMAEIPGGMLAIIGLCKEKIEEVAKEACSFGKIELANINSPEQVVLSGELTALERAQEIAMGKGARLVKFLPVSAPFHSSMMAKVAQRFSKELEKISLRDARLPVVLNANLQPTTDKEVIREALIFQIDHPVNWVGILRMLHLLGVEDMWELGPKAVLTGLVKKTLPGIRALSVEEVYQKETVQV
ncbi:MAG: ACP S-malonyltransferase [bacterium]